MLFSGLAFWAVVVALLLQSHDLKAQDVATRQTFEALQGQMEAQRHTAHLVALAALLTNYRPRILYLKRIKGGKRPLEPGMSEPGLQEEIQRLQMEIPKLQREIEELTEILRKGQTAEGAMSYSKRTKRTRFD